MSDTARDAIVLRGVEFLASHGATEEERLRLQRFSVDCTLSLDLSTSADSDRLRDTADYREIGELIIEIGTKGRHHLLEALAKEILHAVSAQWPQANITITVSKLQPPVPFPVRSIEVSLTRLATQP